MFKRAAAILIILISILPLYSCKTEIDADPPEEVIKIPDFRDCDWGTSMAGVKKAELPLEEVYSDETVMYFELEEEGETLLVYYFFDDDKLIAGECRIEMGNEAWSIRVPQMIERYVGFREDIILRYGEPKEQEYKVWLNKDENYINDPDMHNLYYKRLEYLTEWETESSVMSLRLYYKDRDFKFVYEASGK